MINNIYIGMITSQGNESNFDWINNASKYVDGLAIVWHGDKDEGFDILNKNKGNGFIIQREFYQHHAHSMNDWLLNPKIRPGSWLIIRDSLEKINIEWISKIRQFCDFLESKNINSVYQYGKLLLFKKFEHQFFQSSPHWGLSGSQPNFLSLESIDEFKDTKNCCYSVRYDVRNKDHFIDHFVKYYLYDSSNHLLLGRENKIAEFKLHENIRCQFKVYCEEVLKIKLNVESLLYFFKNNALTNELKDFLNFENILNDFYCYHILNHSLDSIKKRREADKIFQIK